MAENARSILAENAKRYLKEHYAEKFSLNKMSGALFINGCYLLRIFKQETGKTLLHYHNETRCCAACNLLENSGMKIQQIGFQVGFLTASHFSKVFKSVMGLTPKYRASFQVAAEHTGKAEP